MNANTLNAICTIVENPISELKTYYQTRNRANSMGGALEEYIKDVFANTLTETDNAKRLRILEEKFSYTGNQNNPPDSIIYGGDAIEVKKIESPNAAIAFNSSYPKAKLFSDSPMITEACRRCEDWYEKDILYIVGVVPNKNGEEGKRLSKLFFVYGTDYAASAGVYERIREAIRSGINTISDVELSQTGELGRVNRVDPLGITYLRIRGMWGIENPMKVFNYVVEQTRDREFELNAIINEDKYFSFSEEDRCRIEALSERLEDFGIADIDIKTPDNPAKLKSAKLITFHR